MKKPASPVRNLEVLTAVCERFIAFHTAFRQGKARADVVATLRSRGRTYFLFKTKRWTFDADSATNVVRVAAMDGKYSSRHGEMSLYSHALHLATIGVITKDVAEAYREDVVESERDFERHKQVEALRKDAKRLGFKLTDTKSVPDPSPLKKATFSIDETEMPKFHEFIRAHNKKHESEDSTAIGGRFSVTFCSTSIGMIVTLKCSCGKNVDLSGDL